MANTTSVILSGIESDPFDPVTQLISLPSDNSLLATNSSLVALLWFEIIAACFTYGFGFIGNLLSLGIFCSLEEFRKISTGLLFILMTVSDTIHLWTLTTDFLGICNVYIYSNGFIQCQLNNFVENISRAISTYLAVAIVLDRFVRSEWLIRSRMICTRRNAIKLTIAYLIIFALLWSFYFFPYITYNPNKSTCSFTQSAGFYFFLIYIHPPVRAVLACFIPVIIMATTNIRMLSNIRQSHRRIGLDTSMKSMSITANPTTSAVKNGISRRMTALDRMLFYMMLANVGTFIITQIPYHIEQVVHGYDRSLDSFAYSLVRAMLLIWSSLYFGIAFYLYCLTSPLFREKFIIIIKKFARYPMCCPRT